MPDLRISELAAQTGAGLADGDLFAAARSGTANYQVTRTELVAGLATRVTFSDAAKTVDAADRYVAQTGTMSASRIVTLASAANVPAGAEVVIADESGTVSASNTLEIKPSGSETIDGVAAATNYPVIRVPYGSMTFRSNGSNWLLVGRTPGIDVQVFTTSGSQTWRKPFGCSRVRGILIGAGGKGGTGESAVANRGGGGGQAGGITVFDGVPISDLSATETVSVAATTTGTDGAATWFSASTKWVANGGAVGVAGSSAGAGGSTLGQGTITGAYGGAGGNGATSAAGAGLNGNVYVTLGGSVGIVAPGGGGGGGTFRSSTSLWYVSGAGGNSANGIATNGVGLAGGAASTAQNAQNGAAGTASSTLTSLFVSGGGGGSGGSGNIFLIAGTGGNGGTYGAGGGGGGGCDGGSGGPGGNGAQGAAIIESY